MHDNVMSDLESSDPTVSREVYPEKKKKNSVVINKGVGSEKDPYIVSLS